MPNKVAQPSSQRTSTEKASSTPTKANLQATIVKLQAVIDNQRLQIAELEQSLQDDADEKSTALEEAQALTHLGSWQWNVTTNVISWSDELYRIYGMRPQERQIGYEEFMSMIHADDRQHVQEVIGQSFKTGEPFEFEHRIQLPSGQERVLFGMGKVIADKNGQPLRMLGTSQDITGRRRSELELRRSDERFRAVTNATHDLVYDFDVRTGRIWFNEALQSEYGYDGAAAEATVDWWTDHIHPDDVAGVKEQLEQLLASDQQTWHDEHRFQKADNTYTIVRNRAFVLRDHHGQPDRIIGSYLDITEASRLDRAKDEFITLVSHQLRTPLTVIRMYGTMLTDGIAGPLATEQQQYAQKITGASIRLIKLVSDILNISRLELNRIKVESSPTNANELIQNYLDELTPVATARNAVIHFAPRQDLGLVPIDATVFGEIIHNLVDNALRYSNAEQGNIKVGFSKQKRGYILSVRDNGIGIPLAAQPRIFDRFYRADNASHIDGEGTGLGLYLVRLFAENAGGKIWFESTEDNGTTFYVLFPPEGMRLANKKEARKDSKKTAEKPEKAAS